MTISKKALLKNLIGLFLCALLIACADRSTQNDVKTLIRGNGAEPETLDPQLVRSESAGNIVRDMYEGLMTQAADGSLVSGVAETWAFDPSTLCHTFTLRPNAKWSNGDSVNSKDFKRGIEFALDPENISPYSELLGSIKTINAQEPNTLELCTRNTIPYFLEILALPVSFPRHSETRSKNPISNGAYALNTWISQDKVVLKKNVNFHANQTIYFDKIEYISSDNPSSELKRFLAGELDVTSTIPPHDVKRLRKSHNSQIRIAEVLNTYFYGFNLSVEPFKSNPNLRKALSLAVDRDVLVNKILGTGETAAWTLVPDKMPSYSVPKITYQALTKEQRIKEAKRLYKEAGYSNENPVKFELRYNTSALHKKTAEAISAMWKTVLGADVQLYNEEWKVFLQNRRSKNTQMFRSGWIADVNDASNYLELLTSKHPLNDYAYANAHFDELLAQASTATVKRIAILQAAEMQMLQDQAIIPLYYYVSKHMLKPEIQGWQDNILDHHLSRYLSRDLQEENH